MGGRGVAASPAMRPRRERGRRHRERDARRETLHPGEKGGDDDGNARAPGVVSVRPPCRAIHTRTCPTLHTTQQSVRTCLPMYVPDHLRSRQCRILHRLGSFFTVSPATLGRRRGPWGRGTVAVASGDRGWGRPAGSMCGRDGERDVVSRRDLATAHPGR